MSQAFESIKQGLQEAIEHAQNVIFIEEGKVNIHAAFLMFASGQLRFLG